jgi:hypothetical protein
MQRGGGRTMPSQRHPTSGSTGQNQGGRSAQGSAPPNARWVCSPPESCTWGQGLPPSGRKIAQVARCLLGGGQPGIPALAGGVRSALHCDTSCKKRVVQKVTRSCTWNKGTESRWHNQGVGCTFENAPWPMAFTSCHLWKAGWRKGRPLSLASSACCSSAASMKPHASSFGAMSCTSSPVLGRWTGDP